MKEKRRLVIAIVLIVLLAFLVVVIVQNKKSDELTVTFDCHGGTQVENQKIKKGEKLEEPEAPTKEGYEFIGWYYDGKKFDFEEDIDSSIKLEAKWLKISNIKYTVSFDSNGGSSISEQKIEKGKKVNKPENPTREGYTFVEWVLDGKSYDFDSKVEKNITLSAVWKQNAVVKNPTVTGTVTPRPVPTPKPVVRPEEKPEEKPEEIVTPTVKKYMVRFYDNNTLLYTQEVEEGGVAVRPMDPTKTDYVFSEWIYKDTVYDFHTSVVGNINLYASWLPVLELKDVASIKFDQVSSSEPYFNEIKHNQESLDIARNKDVITVSKKQPLIAYANGTGMNKEWFALILDFGVDPNTIEGIDYTINPEDISEAKRLGATTDTAFIVWLDATDRVLTFQKKDGNTVVGSIHIQIEAPKLELNVSSLAQVDASEADLKYNNESISISSKGNIITVVENRFMKHYVHGTEDASWYGLVFDFGIDSNYITVDGKIKDLNVSKYGINSQTAFIIWMKGDIVDSTDTITFHNLIDTADSLEVTVNFKANKGTPYNAEGAITDLPDTVIYNEDRKAFEIDPGVVDGFLFTDNGKRMQAKKENGVWVFEPLIVTTQN